MMNVKQAYAETVADTLHKMHPNWNRGKILEITHHIIKARLRDPSIHMDNNVTGDNANISLTKMCGWVENCKPVVSGNATFYCQPSELKSPTSDMLRTLKKERKSVKTQMFTCKPGSDEYQELDLDQANKKVIMNAEYGGSGTRTAAFYNKYSPAATTLMAQSIITTMAAFFEGYIGNNHKYFHVNECFDWMNKVCQKNEKIPKWIYRPSVKEVELQICKHFISTFIGDVKAVKKYLDGCTQDELTYLYYANNFKELIGRHENIKKLLFNILNTLPNYEAAEKVVPEAFQNQFNAPDEDNVQAYNKWVSKEMFLNPYKIPECIASYMEEFMGYMRQFVYVEYITPDSIIKLNNHKRNTVLLVDTDSNMLNADLFVSFVLKQFGGEMFGRRKMYNEMILVNVLAATIDRSVADILDYYGRCHNMDEDARKELTMKNEFMFRRFFLMQTKKRYAASIVLREGNIIIPFKPEIKGMDFIKAGVTADVSKRFEKMLCDHILFSDTLELHELMRDLKAFEKDIYNDLHSGGMKYLKQQQFKSEGGYKDIQKAWTLPIFRGAVCWNELFEDKKIYSLDKAYLLKLAVSGPSDLEKIKSKYPEEYNKTMTKIFMSQRPEITKSGMKYICIPTSVKKIPDWIIPLIDTELIISDTISVFRSILDALNLEEMAFKTPNGAASITSCLIAI